MIKDKRTKGHLRNFLVMCEIKACYKVPNSHLWIFVVFNGRDLEGRKWLLRPQRISMKTKRWRRESCEDMKNIINNILKVHKQQLHEQEIPDIHDDLLDLCIIHHVSPLNWLGILLCWFIRPVYYNS